MALVKRAVRVYFHFDVHTAEVLFDREMAGLKLLS